MQHDGCLKLCIDGDPRKWAVRPRASMSTMTMTTKTSRRAAVVM